jgi:hypothetical protein
MKNKISNILLVNMLAITITASVNAQTYRAAATDALENNGREWVEKKLPPSVITFSDYSGQVEIKAPISSLFAQSTDIPITQPIADTMADFTMTFDKEQIQQQQNANGKTFTTSGNLIINNISKKTMAQCTLVPRNNPADGFSISVTIRFNPADYGMKITGEPGDTPLIVRVTGNYLNKLNTNY